jgi:hypothetical protein
MKVCSKCKEEKPESDFSKWKLSSDGLQNWCKQCTKDHGSTEKHRERCRELKREKREDPVYRANERAVDKLGRANNRPLYLWQAAKKRAAEAGMEFTIKVEDVVIPTHCPILGNPIVMHTWYAASIDRIDSAKGYTPDNIWVISRKANSMKLNATAEELIKFSQYWLNRLT